MEAIRTLNSFGMEVVSGIILGLDTDKPETGQHLLEFIDASQIPLLTINLLAGVAEDAAVGPAEARESADRR